MFTRKSVPNNETVTSLGAGLFLIFALVAVAAMLPYAAASALPIALTCDDSMKTAFKPDANTRVLLVKAFEKGDRIALSETPTTPPPPVAVNDLCLVKLNVGPGNPGPVGAPSTSPGIGIEVWLPSPANWNQRFHAIGGGGWVGGPHGSTTEISISSPVDAASTAGTEGAVVATTDAGHADFTGSFAMNPDGTINRVLWKDFSERAIHEMAVKTKALAAAYYLTAPAYSYFDGFSTGGRQGLKLAQVNPEDFDGILAGAPAINWSKLFTAGLYPQIVYQRDLAGSALTEAQLNLVSNAAIAECDEVDGQHLGYVADPSACNYDPTTDLNVLCTVDGGNNATVGCVTRVQAQAVNKIWFGMTSDGRVPAPSVDNGWARAPSGFQQWYGLPRGTSLAGLAGASEFFVASSMVALELQNSTIAGSLFTNATGDGAARWRDLSYAQLANAFERGVALQAAFAKIDTDDPDLSKFRDRGAKLVLYHGLADVLVPPQGTINYYHRVAAQLGGISEVQTFTRLYLVPGLGHGLPVVTGAQTRIPSGVANPMANPPLPTQQQLYAAMTDWVEKGIAPDRIDATTAVNAAFPVQKSRPICVYPKKGTYVGGDINVSSSYSCF